MTKSQVGKKMNGLASSGVHAGAARPTSEMPRPADTLKPPRVAPSEKSVTPTRGPLPTDIDRERAEGEGMTAPPAETETTPKRDGKTSTNER